MRLSRVAGVLAGLTVAATASQAGAQSFSRRIDLLRLQDEAVATAAAVFQSSGKSCGVEFARLRTLYADPRFDRMAVDTRRTALFAMMVCAESRDLPFAVHAARRLEPIAVAPMEVSAVHSVQISGPCNAAPRARPPACSCPWRTSSLGWSLTGIRRWSAPSPTILRTTRTCP